MQNKSWLIFLGMGILTQIGFTEEDGLELDQAGQRAFPTETL